MWSYCVFSPCLASYTFFYTFGRNWLSCTLMLLLTWKDLIEWFTLAMIWTWLVLTNFCIYYSSLCRFINTKHQYYNIRKRDFLWFIKGFFSCQRIFDTLFNWTTNVFLIGSGTICIQLLIAGCYTFHWEFNSKNQEKTEL